MTFWQFISNNMTKLLGTITAVLGALQVMLAGGAFNELLDKRTLGWLGIVVGLVTAAVGFNNSSKEKVAAAMQTAIKATPATNQGGFARPMLLVLMGLLSVVAIIGLVPGCASIGIPQASTFNQRLVSAYSTVEGVANLTNTLAIAGKISKGDAQNVVTQLQNCKTALDLAGSIHTTTPDLGENKLQTTLTVLQALSSYLNGVK